MRAYICVYIYIERGCLPFSAACHVVRPFGTRPIPHPKQNKNENILTAPHTHTPPHPIQTHTHPFNYKIYILTTPPPSNTHPFTYNYPQQAVLSLSLVEWRELCEAYSVADPKVPHRPGYKKGKRG